MTVREHRPLNNKVAVVTGATSGVGRCIALSLAGRGADLVLVGRRVSALRSVSDECGRLGVRAVPYEVDLLVEKKIWKLRDQVLRDFSGIDALIHCAGVIYLANFASATLDDFDTQYRCNVRAPFALTQAFLTSLTARRGQVVFINSTAGLQAPAGISQYAATKHALRALADSLREEVNAQGVRVVSLYLGRTATPMQKRVHRTEGKNYQPETLIQPEQAAEIVSDVLETSPQAEITDIRIRPMRNPATVSKAAGRTRKGKGN